MKSSLSVLCRGKTEGEKWTKFYRDSPNRNICSQNIAAILAQPPEMVVWGQFKQNAIDETEESQRKTCLVFLSSVSAQPALPASFLMRHFTMLMRKFPGGIGAPGWGLGICSNLCTVIWRKHTGRWAMVGKWRGIKLSPSMAQISACAASLYLHQPSSSPREEAKAMHGRPVLLIYESLPPS